MSALEVIALDTATPQLRAPGAGDSYTFPRAVEMPLGTANGVLYLNGSKVVSSGSGLVFNSSGNLGLGVTPSGSWTGAGVLQIGLGALYENSSLGSYDLTYNSVRTASNSYVYATSSLAATRFQQRDGAFNFFTAASGNAGDPISFTQAMTLDASGNLVVGDTSTSYRMEVVSPSGDNITALFRSGDATAANNAGGGFRNVSSATAASRQAQIWLDADGANFSGGDYFYIQKNGNSGTVDFVQYSNAAMTFATNNTERARITSGGYFKASNTGGYDNATGTYHELLNNDASDPVVKVIHFGATNPLGMQIAFTAASPDDNTQYFLQCTDSTAVRCIIYSDGDLANHDGVYGTISDQKLKQDIVDASSQWDDIKAIRFRKYRMKTDVAANPDAPYQLGVIAQELEQTSPGLVDEHPDMEMVEVTDDEGNVTQTQQPTGTTTKTVKSSILLMKAAVALQEAMARIETLEAKIAALEA